MSSLVCCAESHAVCLFLFSVPCVLSLLIFLHSVLYLYEVLMVLLCRHFGFWLVCSSFGWCLCCSFSVLCCFLECEERVTFECVTLQR